MTAAMMEEKQHPVTRTLKVTGLDAAAEEVVVAGMSALPGMLSVAVERPEGRLTVIYDLYRLRLAAVEAGLEELGHPPDSSFLQRKKRDWMRYTEQNEYDNLKHEAHCCSQSPK